MNDTFLIASDIHGSSRYCRSLVDLFEKSRAWKMILLGDILYHGPRNSLPKEYDPMKCVSLLQVYRDRIVCIRGNCDAEIDEDLLGFGMTPGFMKLFLNGRFFTATHGHLFNRDHMPPVGCGETLLFGHFHIPYFAVENGITFVNPGSVSIPKENSPCSAVLFDGDTFRWIDLNSGTAFMRKDARK